MDFESKLGTDVSINKIFPDSLFYTIQCDCGSDNCTTHMIVEANKDFKLVTVAFFKEIRVGYVDNHCMFRVSNFIKSMMFRIEYAFKILFTGKIQMDGEFLISDQKQIDDLVTALQESRQYCQRRIESERRDGTQNFGVVVEN